MSYSALFTSGLCLASQPRTESEAQAALAPPLQINIHPGTPRPRKRRSSLTIATSPIAAVKSPLWAANDALRVFLRSPREATFVETLQNNTKPKTGRRKSVRSIQPPPLPPPTTPLPTLPPHVLSSTSLPPPTNNSYSSSPFTSESTLGSRPAWIPPHNHSRKSSSILPPFVRRRSSTTSGRRPLSPSPYAANRGADDPEMNMADEEKGVATAVWFDDEDEDMKENGSEA